MTLSGRYHKLSLLANFKAYGKSWLRFLEASGRSVRPCGLARDRRLSRYLRLRHVSTGASRSVGVSGGFYLAFRPGITQPGD